MNINIEKLLALSISDIIALQDKADTQKKVIQMEVTDYRSHAIWQYYDQIWDICDAEVHRRMEDVFGEPEFDLTLLRKQTILN